jgi:protein TonB
VTESAAYARVNDRLSSTLFLAVLFHGIVILGITFSADPLGGMEEFPTLKVTLLVDTQDVEREQDNYDYLAQRNQAGSGSAADSGRPSAAPSVNDPANLAGSPMGGDLTEARPRSESRDAERLVTRSPADTRIPASPDPNEAEASMPMRAMALMNNPAPRTSIADLDDETSLAADHNRELVINPATRQATLAGYLNGWRRRVERIGTLNFPRSAQPDGNTRWPTLEVAIDRQGALVEIVLRESSQDPALDQAALSILRMAAPFDPLPPEITANYDVLRFAYEWQFSGGTVQPRAAVTAAN